MGTAQINEGTAKASESEKLKLSTKLAFGAGDLYGGGAMMIIGFYYMYFLTDVVSIKPYLAGIVFLISKIWDAVSDPLMGIISDRTRTRFGRRRPYFLAGIPLIFMSFFMMWYPVDFNKETHRFVYIIFAYLFYSTIITMVMIPYNALSAELTLDYNERTSLVSFRIFFSSLSSIICAVIPLELVKAFPDVRTGYIVMAASFGLFFAIPFIATFFLTKEREDFQKAQETLDIKMLFVEPFKMSSFVYVLCMYLFAFVAMDAMMSIMIYFMTYYLGKGPQTNYVLGTMLVIHLAAIPPYYYLASKTTKKTAYITGALIWMAAMIISFFINPTTPMWMIYLFAAVIGVGSVGVVVMIYAMFPDIPDIDELQTGQRREGIYSGLYTFMRKLSSAFAIMMISAAISWAGYKPPVKETVEGVVQMINQQQTEHFLLILRLVLVFIPAAFLLVCLWAASRYRLTPELHVKLKAILNRKRNGEALDEAMLEDEAMLKRVLFEGKKS